MKNLKNYINALLVLGAVQGIVLALLLSLKHRGNRRANRILAAIISLLSFSILLHVFSHSNILPFADTHQLIIIIVLLLISPLILFYVRSLTRLHFTFSRQTLCYFVPFMVCTIAAGLLMQVRGQVLVYDTAVKIIGGIGFLFFAWTILQSNLELRHYERLIKNNFSDLQRINLFWLRVFLFSLTLLWLSGAFVDLFVKTLSWDWIWLAGSIIIYLIGYFGFSHAQVFSIPLVEPPPAKAGSGRKYLKSSLSDDIAANYLGQLQQTMKEQQPYLDKDINLSSLAGMVGMSGHHLSQIINERLGQSFYDFINAQRVEEAKRLLDDPAHETQNIAAIAFQAGFHSLSAFNAAFKKMTATTPSQFRSRS